jgi:hypothetical protein
MVKKSGDEKGSTLTDLFFYYAKHVPKVPCIYMAGISYDDKLSQNGGCNL